MWCWYYLFFDEINIEFGFIWELSAESLQTNPKIRWGLFWGLFKTQNRNIQLFSPVNQCNNHHQHSNYKKHKNEFNRLYYHWWIQLTSIEHASTVFFLHFAMKNWHIRWMNGHPASLSGGQTCFWMALGKSQPTAGKA